MPTVNTNSFIPVGPAQARTPSNRAVAPFDGGAEDRRAEGSERALAATGTAGEELTVTQSGHLRIPVLDGVRGLAILMVVADHSTALPPTSARLLHAVGHWGYTGVDLFFVLSGFLITGILYEAKGGRGYFKNFYARRVLRIFPVYYACLVFGLIVFPLLGSATAYWLGPMYSGGTTWTFWVYLANFTIGQTGNVRMHGMLDAAWSLAIEEQFYIVWPLLVLLLSRTRLMRLCMVLMVAALIVRVFMVYQLHSNWLSVYTNTFCRMDCLAAGALVSLAIRGPKGPAVLWKPALWVFGVSALAVLFVIRAHGWKVFWDGGIGQTGGYSFVVLLYGSGMVLLLNAGPRSVHHRVFAGGFLRLFGRYSYAMYLFHMSPVFLMARFFCHPLGAGEWELNAIAGSYVLALVLFYGASVALTLCAALVSWNVLERHCLALKRYFKDDVRVPAPVDARTVLS
jgi:peptidoglycan/LPS O-acetylase OafA/YrhL